MEKRLKRRAEVDLTEFYPGGKRARKDCPYLGQIKRQALDFDFEKQCSETLSPLNPYACLTCGRYFQGKGKSTPAYTHSLEEQHHVYISLTDCTIWCLPDNYEVEDASLNDVKYNLQPHFTPELIGRLDSLSARALDGTEYLPGCLGLNNLKRTDFVNVALQALCRVKPIRDFCLLSPPSSSSSDGLFGRFAELVKKIWNPKNFKGHVSPHELLQAIVDASGKRFKIGEQRDPMQFLVWFFNALSDSLGSKKKTVIEEAFQGQLSVLGEEGAPRETKFFYLSLDLPQTPLFKDQHSALQQVGLTELLAKYRGGKYVLKTLPPYLLIQVKRFTKNQFFEEKNNTIVNFPLRNLDFSDILPASYDLIANVVHEGKPDSGTYRAQVRHGEEWYDIQDLHVNKILPQQVTVSECYLLLFERQ